MTKEIKNLSAYELLQKKFALSTISNININSYHYQFTMHQNREIDHWKNKEEEVAIINDKHNKISYVNKNEKTLIIMDGKEIELTKDEQKEISDNIKKIKKIKSIYKIAKNKHKDKIKTLEYAQELFQKDKKIKLKVT